MFKDFLECLNSDYCTVLINVSDISIIRQINNTPHTEIELTNGGKFVIKEPTFKEIYDIFQSNEVIMGMLEEIDEFEDDDE